MGCLLGRRVGKGFGFCVEGEDVLAIEGLKVGTGLGLLEGDNVGFKEDPFKGKGMDREEGLPVGIDEEG